LAAEACAKIRRVDFGIAGQVAMVAAASKGIGRATAEALAREGCRVAICARSDQPLEESGAALRALGAEVLLTQCDVNNVIDIERWFESVAETWEPPSILVTNTGGPMPGRVGALDDQAWLAGIETTFLAAVRMSRLAIPAMVERGWGRVVHVTSIVAVEVNDVLALSTTLRSGIRALTRLQAREYGKHGVTVNAVLPGHTRTARQEELAARHYEETGEKPDEYYKRLADAIPVGRLGEPEEVGSVIAFLCSRQASFVNGVSLLVDGGMSKAV
jgi:3-oxoacyl-[acyl-carrier protein] reductase